MSRPRTIGPHSPSPKMKLVSPACGFGISLAFARHRLPRNRVWALCLSLALLVRAFTRFHLLRRSFCTWQKLACESDTIAGPALPSPLRVSTACTLLASARVSFAKGDMCLSLDISRPRDHHFLQASSIGHFPHRRLRQLPEHEPRRPFIDDFCNPNIVVF